MLSCPVCHTLVHGERLNQLAAEAQAAEAAGDPAGALARWREVLALLPENATQRAVVSARIATLTEAVPALVQAERSAKEEAIRARFGGKGRIRAAIGTAVLMLWKLKFVLMLVLTKMKLLILGFTKLGTLLSMLATMGVYWSLWGWPFAVGFVLSIYVHEMGHVSALRHYGIRASAPMFVPFVGAFVRLRESLHSEWQNAMVGLAGPLWGLSAALVAGGAYYVTARPIFAAIAHTGAWINLFNLLPVWQLDGGRGFSAMSRTHRLVAAGGVLLAFMVGHEPLLLIIGVVGGAMAFTKPSSKPDARIAAYYVALVWSLAAVSALGAPALRTLQVGR